MLAELLRWLARKLEGPRPPVVLQLPIFYAIIVSPGHNNIAHETTRSIHRARGICRELKAQGMPVALATYTAEAVTEEF